MVVDLDFIAVMHGHPFFPGFNRNADKHTGVVVLVSHPENYANYAISHYSARPVEQAHAAVSVNQTVFDVIASWTDMLPSVKVFAVVQLLPLIRVALACVFIGGHRHRYE